jgi:DNA-binding transcriptional MerR regulator
MYTVSRAGTLTGVPAATLRKWEQRYGVVEPTRTEGNYRLYDDEAIRRLSAMRDLVDAGWSARDAARQVLAGTAAPSPRPTAGGEAVGDLDALTRCAVDFDALGLHRLLDEELASGEPAEVVDGWLLPSLVRLGEAWSRGEVTVAGEHFASAAVHRRLSRLYDEVPPAAVDAPRVVVGLARGSRHELGVLAFAVVARSRGLDVTYLGSDLPVEAWVATARAVVPQAAVIGVPLVEDLPAVRELASALTPLTRVLLGGAYQDRIAGVEALGHRPGQAADDLAARLHG